MNYSFSRVIAKLIDMMIISIGSSLILSILYLVGISLTNTLVIQVFFIITASLYFVLTARFFNTSFGKMLFKLELSNSAALAVLNSEILIYYFLVNLILAIVANVFTTPAVAVVITLIYFIFIFATLFMFLLGKDFWRKDNEVVKKVVN